MKFFNLKPLLAIIFSLIALMVGMSYMAIQDKELDNKHHAEVQVGLQQASQSKQEIQELQQEVQVLKQELEGQRHEVERQREVYPVSRGGSRVRYAIERAEVTWYNDQGRTASGTEATAGRTVAVDPNVIPLGSHISIVMPDGTIYDRIAEDTGGAVIGNVVDIHSDASDRELNNRGRTADARVFVMER